MRATSSCIGVVIAGLLALGCSGAGTTPPTSGPAKSGPPAEEAPELIAGSQGEAGDAATDRSATQDRSEDPGAPAGNTSSDGSPTTPAGYVTEKIDEAGIVGTISLAPTGRFYTVRQQNDAGFEDVVIVEAERGGPKLVISKRRQRTLAALKSDVMGLEKVKRETEAFSLFSVKDPFAKNATYDEFIVLRGDYVLRTGVDAKDRAPSEIEKLLAVALSFAPN